MLTRMPTYADAHALAATAITHTHTHTHNTYLYFAAAGLECEVFIDIKFIEGPDTLLLLHYCFTVCFTTALLLLYCCFTAVCAAGLK